VRFVCNTRFCFAKYAVPQAFDKQKGGTENGI